MTVRKKLESSHTRDWEVEVSENFTCVQAREKLSNLLLYKEFTNSIFLTKVVIALIKQKTAQSVEPPLATIVGKKAM